MADITLSSAVRSNLLNLQSTADQLGKTQERLATGLKVNSALDNPTNFFTASALESRASDLGRLLDSISNANQTLEAADNGLSSITKLVESAQATARQALQTAETVDSPVGAVDEVIASVDSGDTSAVTIAAADGASVTAGTFSDVDVSAAGSAATAGEVSATFGSSLTFDDAGDQLNFTISVDGGADVSITIDAAVAGTVGNNDSVIDDESELAAAITSAINAEGTYSVGSDLTVTGAAGELTITSGSTGAGSNITLSSVAAVDNAGVDTLTNTSGLTAANVDGTAAVAGDSISFDLTVDGGTTTNVTIDDATVTQYNSDNGTSLNSAALDADDIVALINDQAGATVATNNAGTIEFNSSTTGTGSTVDVANFAASTSSGATGIANATDAGTAGTEGDVTINGQTISLADGDDAAAILGKFEAAATASSGTNAFTVSDASGTLTIEGTAGNDVAISGDAEALGAVGLTAGTTDGTVAEAASTTPVANPKRDEFVSQYNDLLGQIDTLVGDAGINGVNLLNGDTLSVLFNEDGSSSLEIEGVTFDSAGLGLTEVAAGGFNDNDDINTTLDTLGEGVDSLRAQASNFGSNLSVVEIRENFTKNMINTLETGAGNLTLADSNEEAANLLALQTRQQLSSTALSLASQADQNVLRLF